MGVARPDLDKQSSAEIRVSECVVIGGELENVYRQGDEIVVSGTCRIYADEAVPLAIALLNVATGDRRPTGCCIWGTADE